MSEVEPEGIPLEETRIGDMFRIAPVDIEKPRHLTPAEKIAKLFIFGFRWFPPGRKSPERTTPPAQIDRRTAEAHFLAAVEAWDQVDRALLPERQADLFVKHPRMGDLTVEEWMRFHVIHARHHAKQIRQRVGR